MITDLTDATPEQVESLIDLWARAPQGQSYIEFRNKAHIGYDGILFVPWCGMVIGIERDGYAHS